MVLDVEVQAGNQTASSFAQPELWALLDGLPEPSRPAVFARGLPLGNGACDGGSRATQDRVCVQTEADRECEEADRRLFGQEGGRRRGNNGRGERTELRLSGWSKERRVVVLRRPLAAGSGWEEKRRIRKREHERATHS